jgi:hypothetical protein
MANEEFGNLMVKMAESMMKGVYKMADPTLTELPKTRLYKAAFNNRHAEVKEILKTTEGRATINTLCDLGWSPLHIAAVEVRF